MDMVKDYLPLVQLVILPLLYLLHKLDKTIAILNTKLEAMENKLENHLLNGGSRG